MCCCGKVIGWCGCVCVGVGGGEWCDIHTYIHVYTYRSSSSGASAGRAPIGARRFGSRFRSRPPFSRPDTPVDGVVVGCWLVHCVCGFVFFLFWGVGGGGLVGWFIVFVGFGGGGDVCVCVRTHTIYPYLYISTSRKQAAAHTSPCSSFKAREPNMRRQYMPAYMAALSTSPPLLLPVLVVSSWWL